MVVVKVGGGGDRGGVPPLLLWLSATPADVPPLMVHRRQVSQGGLRYKLKVLSPPARGVLERTVGGSGVSPAIGDEPPAAGGRSLAAVLDFSKTRANNSLPLRDSLSTGAHPRPLLRLEFSAGIWIWSGNWRHSAPSAIRRLQHESQVEAANKPQLSLTSEDDYAKRIECTEQIQRLTVAS